MAKEPVLLERCADYVPRLLQERFDNAAEQLRLPASFRGRTVLLKPNLVSGHAPQLACSDGRFLREAARWFLDRSARVLLGDSPAFGTTASVLRRQRIEPLLADLSLTVVEFSRGPSVQLSHGAVVTVAREAVECDFLVNLPRYKAHGQMYVTGAVKNLFGIVCGMKKAVIHMRHGASHDIFSDVILDLIALLPQRICMVDAIDVMHRTGPARGEPLHLGCLAAARSEVAVDRALLDVLELPAARSPLAVAAMRRGMAGADRNDLSFPGLLPESFHGSGFVPPETLDPVPFNPIRFVVSTIRRWRATIGRVF